MLYLLILLTLCGSAFPQLPKGDCTMGSDLNSCLKNYVKKAISVLATDGVTDLNIPKIDPLKLKDYELQFGSPLANGSIKVTDITVKGLGKMDIKNINADLKNHERLVIKTKEYNPELSITGSYSRIIKLYNQPDIVGDGTFKVLIKGVKTELKLIGHTYGKGNNNYIDVDTVNVQLVELKDFYIDITNLLPSNPSLGILILSTLNNMWPLYYKEAYILVEPFVEFIAKDYLNEFFSKVPASDIVKQ